MKKIAISQALVTNYINYLLLLFALTMPLFKNFNRATAIFLLFLWIIEGGLKNKFSQIYHNKVIFSFAIFIIYSYISILWSENIEESFHYVSRYLYYFIIVIIFTSIQKEYIGKVIIAFLFGMFISEVVSYGIFFDLWTTKYNEYAGRPFPTAFMGHTAYSVLLVFTMLLTANKLFYKNNLNIQMKIFYITLLLLIFGTLLISGGRTGLLVLLAVITIVTVTKYRKNMLKPILGVLILLLMFFVGYKNINIFKYRIDAGISDVQKIINQNNYTTSFGSRVGFIHLGFEMFKDNPFLGVGIKDNIELRAEYALKDENKAMLHFTKWAPHTHFHNEYIEILTSIGLIGLVIFLYFLYSIFKIQIRDTELYNIKLIFATLLVFSISTSAFFHHRQPIAFLALFIGILLAQSKFEEIERKREI